MQDAETPVACELLWGIEGGSATSCRWPDGGGKGRKKVKEEGCGQIRRGSESNLRWNRVSEANNSNSATLAAERHGQ